MTTVPPRGPRRASIISPLVLGDSVAQVVVTDEQDRRGVLVELRLDRMHVRTGWLVDVGVTVTRILLTT